jgi:hypothetical protein
MVLARCLAKSLCIQEGTVLGIIGISMSLGCLTNSLMVGGWMGHEITDIASM